MIDLLFFQSEWISGLIGLPVITGLLKNSCSYQDRQNKKFQITILGGSQGSSFINSLIMESLPFLESIKNRIRIVHQTGKADYKKIKTSYQQTKIEFEANVF